MAAPDDRAFFAVSEARGNVSVDFQAPDGTLYFEASMTPSKARRIAEALMKAAQRADDRLARFGTATAE